MDIQPYSDFMSSCEEHVTMCHIQCIMMKSNNSPVTENQHIMKQTSGNRELRYIVIDGSNVAMQ